MRFDSCFTEKRTSTLTIVAASSASNTCRFTFGADLHMSIIETLPFDIAKNDSCLISSSLVTKRKRLEI